MRISRYTESAYTGSRTGLSALRRLPDPAPFLVRAEDAADFLVRADELVLLPPLRPVELDALLLSALFVVRAIQSLSNLYL